MKLLEQLADLLLGFTVARARSVILLLLILFGAAWIIDWKIEFSAYNRLERAVSLTERLDALERRGQSSKEITELRSSLIAQLRVLASSEAASLSATANGTLPWFATRLAKGIAGAAPWVLMSVVMMAAVLKTSKLGWAELITIVISTQVYSVGFGLVSILIPSSGKWWIDLLVVPWSLVAALVLVAIFAATVIPAFRTVRHKTQGRAIMNNLRQISAAADHYFLEKGQTRVTYADLVGSLGYLRPVESVDGERYDDLVIEQGRPLMVKRRSGDLIAFPG